MIDVPATDTRTGAGGGKSSFRMVAVPREFLIVAPVGFDSTRPKVSSDSILESPSTLTETVFEVSPGAKTSFHDAAA